MMERGRRSFLGELLAAAAGLLVAGGLLLFPSRSRARPQGEPQEPPNVAPEYGVKRQPSKPPPDIAPDYGVKRKPVPGAKKKQGDKKRQPISRPKVGVKVKGAPDGPP